MKHDFGLSSRTEHARLVTSLSSERQQLRGNAGLPPQHFAISKPSTQVMSIRLVDTLGCQQMGRKFFFNQECDDLSLTPSYWLQWHWVGSCSFTLARLLRSLPPININLMLLTFGDAEGGLLLLLLLIVYICMHFV